MDRIPVQSSNLASVGYEGDILEVEFRNGRIYQYFTVPEWVHRDLMEASSVGTYFNQNIRNAYPNSAV